MSISVPIYSTVIVELFTKFDSLLDNYVHNGYQALAGFLNYPLGMAVILYIVLMGYSITQGWVKLSMGNFTKSALKIGFIYMAAMNWSWFSQYVVDLFTKGAGQIGDVLINATPIPLPHFAGEGIVGALQSTMIEVSKIGWWTWNMGSWRNLSPCFEGLLIWGFGYAQVIVGVFELLLSQMMLSILFASAPLFICFTIFKPTQGFFDRWLGLCVGFALVRVFISATLALTLSIMQWTVGDMYASKAINMTILGCVPLVITGILGVGILLSVTRMAQAIGGNVSTSSGSALLAGTVGGMVGGSVSTLKLPTRVMNGLRGSSGVNSKESSDAAMEGIRENMLKGNPADKKSELKRKDTDD